MDKLTCSTNGVSRRPGKNKWIKKEIKEKA